MASKRAEMVKMYTQGEYKPIHPEKVCKKAFPLLYRSRPEYLIMRWMDLNENIVEWTSEAVVIWYKKPVDGKMHRYFIDFSCKYRNKDGTYSKYLLEYKPRKFTKVPQKTKRMSNKTYMYLAETWAVNNAKWKAANDYAKKNNMKFLVISEDSLGIDKNK